MRFAFLVDFIEMVFVLWVKVALGVFKYCSWSSLALNSLGYSFNFHLDRRFQPKFVACAVRLCVGVL